MSVYREVFDCSICPRIEGLANKEHAAGLRDCTDSELKRIDARIFKKAHAKETKNCKEEAKAR